MFHRSERLLLRPIWPEDWQAVLGGISDEGVVRNLARAPWPYGEAEARAFTGLASDPRHPRFLVTTARNGAAIGCVGIERLDGGGAAELGYWIARAHWGRGYATEAAGAALDIARMLGHREIVAAHFLDNPASGRVLRKLGFEPNGQLSLRRSCARGHDVETAEYRLNLDETSRGEAAAEGPASPEKRAA